MFKNLEDEELIKLYMVLTKIVPDKADEFFKKIIVKSQ